MIKTITDGWIKEHNPCSKALDWWDKEERDSIKILTKLIKEKRYDWANWMIVRVMTYEQYVSYAVYAAEQVIDIYEKKYPDNKHPRNAIEAAKKCIKNPSKENKAAARAAAWSVRAATRAATRAAAEAAARAAVWSTAEAAARAAVWSTAEAAAWSVRAAAEAAAEAAARATVWSTAEAAARAAVWSTMRLEILEYGMELLIRGK